MSSVRVFILPLLDETYIRANIRYDYFVVVVVVVIVVVVTVVVVVINSTFKR